MRNIFILLFTLCFVMCAPRQSDNTISVDLDHPEKASLFDYFSSLELIPLKTKGQGAGEYAFISDFNINPFSGNLEILEPYGRIHVYSLLGDFIETKRISYPEFKVAHSLAALDNDIYVSHSLFEPKKIAYFDLNKQKLLHEEFEEDISIGSYSQIPYQYKDEWFFYRPFHPIVYKIGKKQLEASFKFDFGGW